MLHVFSLDLSDYMASKYIPWHFKCSSKQQQLQQHIAASHQRLDQDQTNLTTNKKPNYCFIIRTYICQPPNVSVCIIIGSQGPMAGRLLTWRICCCGSMVTISTTTPLPPPPPKSSRPSLLSKSFQPGYPDMLIIHVSNYYHCGESACMLLHRTLS